MGHILTAAQAEADRTTFIPGLSHVARDLGVTAQEKCAVASIIGRQTSAEFALSALVNCTVTEPKELHALILEVARIADRLMYGSAKTYEHIDEVVSLLDAASDVAEKVEWV